MTDTVRSMTGFGSGVRESAGFHLTAEIASVNHRYLKVVVHLPEELGWASRRIEEQVRGAFARGSLNVVLNLEATREAEPLEIDRALLTRLYQELSEVGDAVQAAPVQLGDLLGVDGVVRRRPTVGLGAEDGATLIEGLVAEAIQNLRQMQSREGGFLRDELARLLSAVEVRLDEVEVLLPKVAGQSRERYLARVQELLAGSGVTIEEGDVVREVAVLAEKADVTEELSRLRGHMEQFRDVLERGGRVGRKLDFLTQEMFRESGTMAAKAGDYELARLVVEIKADIDRLREQAQNVE